MSVAGPTRPRRGRSPLGSPVLIGAITTLIVLVGVYLAYDANNGLPFVPTRELKVDFPNGQELVKGDEVRDGGLRVGIVSKMVPVRLADGQVVAQATLKLDKSAGGYPIDSSAVIRPRTALGLEYVDLSRGHAAQTIADGGSLSVGHAQSEVELDQVLATFDQPTRAASVTNLDEFGGAFAARGPDLSSTVSELPRTLGLLDPVAANLNNANTRLSNLITQLDVTADTIAPVSPAFAHLFTTMANTFGAINRDPAALADTIRESPPTFAVGTRSLAAQRPFLTDLAGLGRDLSPAFTELRGALPTVNAALVTGTKVTRRTPALYSELQGAVGALRDLAQTPTTNAALRGLTATVDSVQPQVRYLGPYITVCNSWNYWWTFLGNAQTAPTPEGYALRALVMAGDTGQVDDVGTEPAALPAHGGIGAGTPTFLHNAGLVYGTAITSGGLADCSAGQSGYIQRSLPAGVPKQYANFNVADTAGGLPTGYRMGSTFAYIDAAGKGVGRGPDKVPAGETFSAEPGGLGAQISGPASHGAQLPTLNPVVAP